MTIEKKEEEAVLLGLHLLGKCMADLIVKPGP